MKILGALLAAFLALPAWGQMIVERRNAIVQNIPACGLPDTFVNDPFALPCWIKDYGGTQWAWNSTSHQIDWADGGGAVPRTYMHFATPILSADSCAKVQIIFAGGSESSNKPGLLLRASSPFTGVSSNAYGFYVQLDGANAPITWAHLFNGTSTDIGGCSMTSGVVMVSGDYLGVCIKGTATGSVMSAWLNPSGSDDPGTWGTASCTVTDCGTECVDTGNFGGIFVIDSGAGHNRSFDNYTAAVSP